METNAKVYVAGHRGLVGSAIVRQLVSMGWKNILIRAHADLDLTNQATTLSFFEEERPEYVVLAAAKVGGIMANNTYPADFIYNNLMIQANVIRAAYCTGVSRLLFLGSSCIYPRESPQPIKEKYLLTGPLEPTNRPYAVAKIAGIEQCWSYNRQYGTRYLAVMPTNLYGPGDNYDLCTSHVIPALIRKFHLAKLAMHGEWNALDRDVSRFGAIPTNIMQSLKEGGKQVILWGDGSPLREFMYSEDMAQACLFLLQLSDADFFSILNPKPALANAGTSNHSSSPPLINVGTGEEFSIAELAKIAATVVGYRGVIDWDTTKPNGTPRKILDISLMRALGFRPSLRMEQGMRLSYQAYLHAN